MTVLRTLAVWLMGLPITIALFILVLFSLPFERQGRAVHSIGAFWSRVVLALSGVRVDVKGRENVPSGRPVIFVSNHQGAFDIPALQAFLPVQFRWVAKKSLFRIPVIGWSMSLAGYVGIDRDNPSEAMKNMDEASEKIRNGTSVLIFPEGTRSGSARLLPFKRGAFVLAKKSGVPVVPVAIDGTSDIMRRGGLLIRPSRVRIRIGSPVETGPLGEKELRNRMKKDIEGLLQAGSGRP
ncbi:MAG: lysophospholipid acyltransferase family protein [Thermodesulfobacteriota bacterium]|nr:MAG: lysophospholipid acyltransferase family protein [Thermodesulfobacteriota bacterium]